MTLTADSARLILNRPEAGNRVTTDLLQTMVSFLREVSVSEAALLVVEGRGTDFCLGRDASGDVDHMKAQESLSLIVEVGRRLRDLPALVVCSVQGRARGFGAGVVMHSDLVVAAQGANLAFDEVERGFPPTIVMSYLESHLPRKLARELVCTGRELSVEDAHRLGVVNRVVETSALASETERLCTELLAQPRAALKVCKPFLLASAKENQAMREERAVRELVAFLLLNRKED
jgi:enoyl-CoA hydratase/carnithine racemase